MANTKLPARLLDTSAIPALNVTGDLTVDTTTLKVDSTNNRVGIGVASPTTALHVNGAISLDYGTGVSYQGIKRTSVGNEYYVGTTSTGTHEIHTFTGSSAVKKMVILESGNVGIGTDSPHGKLQFASDINTRKIVLYEGGNNNYQFYGFGVESQTLVYSTYEPTDDHVFFSGASTTSRNELMRIEGTGNVGIGIASPLVKLDVRGSASAPASSGTAQTGSLRVSQTAGNGVLDMGFYASATGTAWIQSTNKSNLATNYGLTLQPNGGNVGIGTTAPGFPLDVSASIASTIGQTSTYNYGSNRNWAMRTNNYGSSNWGGWSLEQSTGQDLAPTVARIGVHLNGNVGINMGGDASSGLTSINPATALHVGGDITVGSADSVGTGGTASIRFQNDNERSRITSNYASGGGGQMGFWTDTTGGSLLQRMTIRNSGIVTMPYQPGFKIAWSTKNATGSGRILSTAAGDSVKSGRDQHNTGSHFSTATGRFTAPVAGTYLLGFQAMRNANNGTGLECRIKKNGSYMWARAYQAAFDQSYQYWSIVTTTNCAAGDYFQVYIGPDVSIYDDDTYFYGHLLG